MTWPGQCVGYWTASRRIGHSAEGMAQKSGIEIVAGKSNCNDTAKVGEFESNAELESRNGKR